MNNITEKRRRRRKNPATDILVYLNSLLTFNSNHECCLLDHLNDEIKNKLLAYIYIVFALKVESFLFFQLIATERYVCSRVAVGVVVSIQLESFLGRKKEK